MTATFNEGDRLRVVRRCCSAEVGDTGVVRENRFVNDKGFGNHQIESYSELYEKIEADRPTPVVGKTYRLTGEPKTAAGNEAFTSTRPKPTQVEIVSLVSTTGNVYVVASGVHQWIDSKLIGAEVKPEEAAAAVAEDEIKVGDTVEITRRPGGGDGSSGRVGQKGEVTRLYAPGEFISDACVRVKFPDSPSDGSVIYRDQVKLVTPEPLVIEVGKSYRLLPNAFTNQGSDEFPSLRGYVEASWKGGHPSVVVTRLREDGDVRIDRPNGGSQIVHKSFLAPLDSAPALLILDDPTPATDPKDETIRGLRAELTLARERHQKDIAKIGEALKEEAESRGWCSEFNTFVADLNGDLNIELEGGERDYEVTVYFSQTITVSASDDDAAIEAAREHYDYGRRLGEDEEYESPDVSVSDD